MAWEWVGPVATGVVGVVGMGITWSTSRREHKVRALERQEQRRAETYVDMLVHISQDWIPVLSTVGVVVGKRPEPRSPEDELMLGVRLDAFASPTVRDLYGRLKKAVRLLVYTQSIIRARHEHRVRPDGPIGYEEPADVRDLSDAELASLKEKRLKAAEQARAALVEQVRQELSGRL